MHGIGLDLSTVKTGWFECDGDKLLGGRVIEAAGVFTMANAVKFELEYAKPDYVAIEDIYIHPNAKFANPLTFKELAGLQYLVCEKLWENGIPYYLGHAASIDSACGIRGFQKRAARKKDVQAFAKTLGFVLPEDAADALAVLWWGRAQHQRQLMVAASKGEE